MTRLRLRSLLLAAGAFALFSCAEPTAPTSSTAAPSTLFGLPIGGGGGVGTLVDTTVTAVQRAVPLLADVSASATIGYEGGSIVLPGTGFRLDVPKGAVLQPTTITVTAVAGSTVAYEFEPAGTTFAKRLVVTQDLSLTTIVSSLLGRSVTGAYFRSRDELFPDGTAKVHELEPTTVDLTTLTTRFSIGHFSGYIMATD
ncbi:MAG TPA: hypothetical protein VF761_05915 [Gemmatimonadaceae bacterium]